MYCPVLPIKIARYAVQGPNGAHIRQYGIPVQVLDLPMLEWAREQRNWETRTDFASQVEHLLVEFASNDILGGIARSENLAEKNQLEISRQNGLMRKLADMSAIWKIWSAKEFFIRPATDPDRVMPMKMSFEYAQTHLKMCAGTILSRLEGEVLQGVNNNYLKQPNIKKKESPRFWAAMNVAMWLSMTQLILMYRETEYLSIVQPQTYAPGMDTGGTYPQDINSCVTDLRLQIWFSCRIQIRLLRHHE